MMTNKNTTYPTKSHKDNILAPTQGHESSIFLLLCYQIILWQTGNPFHLMGSQCNVCIDKVSI